MSGRSAQAAATRQTDVVTGALGPIMDGGANVAFFMFKPGTGAS